MKVNKFDVSKVINAPQSYVYGWCTDYAEDDSKLTHSKTRRVILHKSPQRAIYLQVFKQGGRTMMAVNLVSMKPPKSWHLDYFGEEADEVGDYRLVRLEPSKTRLDMSFKVEYKTLNAPTKAEDVKQTKIVWDSYAAALEKEYRSRKP